MDALVSFFYCCFFKQNTAYEMRISDWSSDVCSSDLVQIGLGKIQRLICRHHGEAQLPVTCGIAGKPRIEPFRSEITRRCYRQRFGRLSGLHGADGFLELQKT